MKRILQIIERAGTVKGLQVFQILRFLSFFITGILLSKTILTTQEIGTYENLIFLSGAFSFFWVSGILNATVAQYNKTELRASNELIFNSGFIILVLNILLVSVLFLMKPIINELIAHAEDSLFSLLILYILLNNPTYIIEYYLLLKEKPLQLVLYGVGSFILHLTFVFTPLVAGGNLIDAFKGLLFLAFLKNLVLIYLLRANGVFKPDKAICRKLMSVAVPLIISFLIAGSAEYIDGFLISTHFGNEAFAIFRYGAREFPVSLLMANALSMAIIPQLQSGHHVNHQGLKKLKKETTSLMHLLFPISILLILVSPYLYPALFRKEFISSASIFNIYLLLVVSRLLFPQSIIMSQVRTSVIFKTSIIEISINIIASYLLMLKFGMTGVAFGTFLAYLSEKVILVSYCHYRLKIPLTEYLEFRVWIFYTVLLLIVYTLSSFQIQLWR